MIKKVTGNTIPLCYMPDGKLICYQFGYIVVFENGVEAARVLLFKSIKERILGKCRLINRIMRLGIRAAVPVDNDCMLLSVGNTIYEYNLATKVLSNGFFCGDGIRPLYFSKVKDIVSIENGIYFGGYLGNKDKHPVNIYRRKGVDQWEIVYTFSEGSINHVHNIVSDPYRNCLWIFTGDFEKSSAIWKVTENFKKVECVVCNNQKYRGCVVYVLPEGLLYATDAPFANDYIYLLNPETKEMEELYSIDGSCIYGCQWNNYYVFSTTVEGDGRDMNRFEWLFTRKRGAGIKDDYVHMYMGNLKDGFHEIYKEKKDRMPYYTFQFGVFKFPYGNNNTNSLYFQSVATMKNDQNLMALGYHEALQMLASKPTWGGG